MTKPTKQKKARKGKIKISSTAHLAHKNDNTKVDAFDTTGMKKAPTQTKLPTNGITFKVRMRRK